MCTQIIQQYVNRDYRVIVIENRENLGASESRNIAIDSASGEYIAFLDSDDLWKSQKLEIQIELMESEGVALSYSNYDTIDENGYLIGEYIAPSKVTYQDMLRTSLISRDKRDKAHQHSVMTSLRDYLLVRSER